MDKIEQLSGYEKSDYLTTLASILDATGHTSLSFAITEIFRKKRIPNFK